MKLTGFYDHFEEFDKESQKILSELQNNVIAESYFQQNNVPIQSIQLNNRHVTAADSIPDFTNWQTDEHVNLKLLTSKINHANSGMRNYILEYNPKDYSSNTQNKSLSLPGENFIRLKAYVNSKAENVSVKWDRAQISQEIVVSKEKIYYRLCFFYEKSLKEAIVLETYSYQEFRGLNILLGYGDIDKYKDDYDYFLKNFANALKKYEDPKSLKFLYENIPDTILPNLFQYIDNTTFFKHLEMLSKADDSDIFKDSSSAVIQIFKAVGDAAPILKHFRENPDQLNRIYYNLDGSSEYEGKMQSNRMILANIMVIFSMFANNDKRKKEAETFTIGKGYKINSNILEGGIFQRDGDQYRDTFFLQQQKEYFVEEEGYETDDLGISTNAKSSGSRKEVENLDEGAQYHPLDMVYVIDISGGTEETYLVPAIYLKAMADVQEWAVVHQNLRIAANLVAIVIGVATLATTGNPYFILLAAADITLAGADITIQAFKDEIAKYEGGAEFLANWEKIYMAGGFALAGLTIVGGFYIGATRLLTKIADGSAKNYLKTLVLKAVLETNISNFTKDTIKVVEPKEVFLGAEYKALGEKMAENGVIFLSGQKEGKFAESYAAMYKGEVIEEFTKAEMPNFYKKWSKLQGEKLIEELEHAGGNNFGASIIATTDAVKIKAFEEGIKQFSKTIAKPFEKIKEAMPYFNHYSVGNALKQVDTTNCGNVVEVITEFLRTGKLRLAETSGFQSFEEIIAKCRGGHFQPITIPRMKQLMAEEDIVIIYGIKEKNSITGSTIGHYFVGMKKGGELHLFDGQTGEYVVFAQTREYGNFIQRGYKEFRYTKVRK